MFHSINSKELADIVSGGNKLNYLLNALLRYRAAVDSEPEYQPPRPRSSAYSKAAEKIGMNPREFELYFEHILENMNGYYAEMLSNMMIHAKLAFTEPGEQYQKELTLSQENYKTRLERWKTRIAKLKKTEEEVANINNDDVVIKLHETWKAFVDHIKEELLRVNNIVDKLGNKEKEFVRVLDSLCRVVVLKADQSGQVIADISWEIVREELNPEHIRSILHKWSQILATIEHKSS